MEQKDVFALRLKNARMMKGLSMDALVQSMGNVVSKMTISKYENSLMAPNSTVLIALSNALDQPIDYFFRPFTLHVDTIKFRKTKSKLSAKQESAIREKISDLVERYQNVEEICGDSVQFSSPLEGAISDENAARKAALEVRALWNIGQDGIVNVIGLLEEHGIKVLEIEAPDSFDGLSAMVNGVYPVIILNKSFSSERKRFTALHELGHLLLSFSSPVMESKEEKLCHCFANEMLIPEIVFRKELGQVRQCISYQELRSIQMKYGISCDALMYKAKSCGLISEQRFKSFCIQKNQNSEFKLLVEQSLYPEEEICRFTSLVYKALCNEFISFSKAASLLHQSVEQVRSDLHLL